MKKLNEDECQTMNTFMEYLKHLEDSKIVFGVSGRTENVELINIAIALALTIKKKEEVKVEDPFAQEV